ncbi:MAG: LamG-like jellyroll fold domain-containing protein [Abditibacteriaceae bacterium]
MQFSSLTKKIALIAISIIAFTTISYAASDASGLLLYAPFEQDAVPQVANANPKPAYNNDVKIGAGKVGNAASVIAGQSQLVFDGLGNAYSQAGTVSFFWRLDADPAGKAVAILNLSPLGKADDEPYLLLSYVAGKFQLNLSTKASGGQTSASESILIIPGQWHYITLCWDQTQGAELFVDGNLAFGFNKSWIYNERIGSIGLGISNSPGELPVTQFSQSFDEFRVYDRLLDDADLALLKDGKTPISTVSDASSLGNQRSKLYQWNIGNAGKMPQVKVGIGGGLGLRQASYESTQPTSGETLFDGDWDSFWPTDGSEQKLLISLQKNQPFDVVQILGAGKMTFVNEETQTTLANFTSDDVIFRDYIMPVPVETQRLSLHVDPNSAASQIQLFKQIRYPYEFNNSWEKLSLRQATDADQSLDAMLHIRQAFYTSDQQTFIAQDGASSGQITLPTMRIFHIIGPKHSQSQTLNAIAVELNIVSPIPEFVRLQIGDPNNPFHFLTSVDIHLNQGPGVLRLLLVPRNIVLPPETQPVINITFSDNVTLDLSNSNIRYQWQG